MLSTTDAIVLSLQPHSDKAHVLHAYTRAGGRINYMVYGLGRKNAAGRYTPFSVIQITANHTSTQIPAVKESTAPSARRSVNETVYKQTIRLFICEVLFHTLRHPMQDEPMFDFLEQAVRALDETDEPQNFHLSFLIAFAAQLGFAIDEEEHPELVRIPATRAERQSQLRALCDYFSEHVETFRQPRSLDILMEVFD